VIRRAITALLGRGRALSTRAASPSLEKASPAAESLRIDFPACIERDFPEVFETAWMAVDDVLATVSGTDLSSLARRSPGLQGYGWENYLRCSVARMVRVLEALSRHVERAGRVLDFGAYFGNFSLMCARAGYQVEALDSYRFYGPAMAKASALLRERGVEVLDFEDLGSQMDGLRGEHYDAVLCLGVIEHIPHTPRPVLEALDRVLKKGGLLVVDTPNLAYLYNRQRLSRGETIFCPLALQYRTELPFEGHHREFTSSEVRWMLEQLHHEILGLDTFNYSLYGLDALQGQDLENYRLMAQDPSMREVILSLSRKVAPSPPR